MRATTIDKDGKWVFEKQANKYGAHPQEMCLHCCGAGPECCASPKPRTFASGLEARRYAELKILERAGLINSLEIQHRFPLTIQGILVTTYIADFFYYDTGKRGYVVEDTKSKATKTDSYRIKKKLLKALWGFDIQEVYAK
jgi:hypothetical protein